jgi:hypothetical protein
MLVNGQVTWNMAVSKSISGICCFELENWKFWLILCKQLISGGGIVIFINKKTGAYS